MDKSMSILGSEGFPDSHHTLEALRYRGERSYLPLWGLAWDSAGEGERALRYSLAPGYTCDGSAAQFLLWDGPFSSTLSWFPPHQGI